MLAGRQRRPPRLLVSVRSAEEATAALAGGADIVDVKEPDAGPLGRATASVLHAISAVVGQTSSSDQATDRPAISAALGEVREWLIPPDNDRLPVLQFAKLGVAGERDHADWVTRWLRARREIEGRTPAPPDWIAVCYADADAARSPAPTEIADAAIATGCVGLLVDTFGKQSGRLTDHLDVVQLAELAERVHRHGLLFAIAGRLSPEMLPALRTVPADVIGVRSAVCHNQDRTQPVDVAAVRSFRRQAQLQDSSFRSR